MIIDESGGDVLKLVGDGILAVFQADDPPDICGCALKAHRLACSRLEALTWDMLARGLPVTTPQLGLQLGRKNLPGITLTPTLPRHLPAGPCLYAPSTQQIGRCKA